MKKKNSCWPNPERSGQTWLGSSKFWKLFAVRKFQDFFSKRLALRVIGPRSRPLIDTIKMDMNINKIEKTTKLKRMQLTRSINKLFSWIDGENGKKRIISDFVKVHIYTEYIFDKSYYCYCCCYHSLPQLKSLIPCLFILVECCLSFFLLLLLLFFHSQFWCCSSHAVVDTSDILYVSECIYIYISSFFFWFVSCVLPHIYGSFQKWVTTRSWNHGIWQSLIRY